MCLPTIVSKMKIWIYWSESNPYKNWKIYWSQQSFTGLGPEDWCPSWGLLPTLFFSSMLVETHTFFWLVIMDFICLYSWFISISNITLSYLLLTFAVVFLLVVYYQEFCRSLQHLYLKKYILHFIMAVQIILWIIILTTSIG